MTSTTANFNQRMGWKRRGFSLVELMAVMTIGSILLAATMSSYLFIARSSVNVASYARMDAQARRGLELFSRDVRMAYDVANFSPTSLTLKVPTATGVGFVTYRLQTSDRTFYRVVGTTRTPLIRNIDTFTFRRFKLPTEAEFSDLEADNDIETKQIQLELRALDIRATKANSSNAVISARFIMRNKIVGD
jgi:prepilin-type N-terminal cleavage/methylation domain-containing protein